MFLIPDQQLSRCDRIMQQRLEPYLHSVMSQCSLRAYDNPGEPEPSKEFLDRVRKGEVEFLPFAIPGVWGTTWGTTWFEISGQVDLGAAKGKQVELVVDLGWHSNRGPGFQAEGLVYRADGTAIKSANPRNSWIPLISADGTTSCDIDGNGCFTLYLEAAANPFVEGPTPFSPTDRGEKATGKPEDPYTLRHVDVAVLNRGAYEYLMDLETVSSLIRELSDDDPRYWQLAKALQRSMNIYDEVDMSTLVSARQALASVLSEPASSSVIKHVAIGHAHIDSAWLWPVRETKRKVARTVSNVLALMDEDPDFKYAMSSAQQYAWLEEEHPDLFKRLKDRVAEGRFIPVGGMWVESDGMLPTGESLVRQITFGRRYFQEHLGVQPRGIWLPDSFGYTGSWPQIARKAGYDWFLTQKISWNDTTKFPHHSFNWEGIDGTSILTHFPPSDTYCSSVSMHDVTYSQKNFLEKDLSRNAILLYGYGDGGGGPTREMNSRVCRLRNLNGAPRVDFGSPDELFDLIHKDIVEDASPETPYYKGELYFELHRATLTSQQDMKRGCRMEEALLRTVEYLCAAASIKNPSFVYPNDRLNRIWETLLLNQFHDILPGSAIAWVHRLARQQYAEDLMLLETIAKEANQAIVDSDPTLNQVDQAAIAPVAATRSDDWRAKKVSEFTAHCTALASDFEQVLVEASKADLVAQKDSTLPNIKVDIQKMDGRTILDNGMLRVVVEGNGTISSVLDLHVGRELVPKGCAMGGYELLKDQPYQWDAWDIQRDSFLMAHTMEQSQVDNVSQLSDGSAVVNVIARDNDVRIVTRISLQPAAKELDFKAIVDWQTKEQFLKVDMPLSLQPENAQYESQYGLVTRAIQKNTRSDEAKFESCTHRFIRLAEASYSAAVVNATTFGSDLAPIHNETAHDFGQGTMVRLSLLSAPLYPDPKTDQGLHSFAWTLVANADMDSVLSNASRLSTPVLPTLADFAPLASVEQVAGVTVLDWIKLADDGSGDVIVRIYEAQGGRAEGVLHVCDELRNASLSEVNLMEEEHLDDDLARALPVDRLDLAEGAPIHLGPFQLTTLRVRRH